LNVLCILESPIKIAEVVRDFFVITSNFGFRKPARLVRLKSPFESPNFKKSLDSIISFNASEIFIIAFAVLSAVLPSVIFITFLFKNIKFYIKNRLPASSYVHSMLFKISINFNYMTNLLELRELAIGEDSAFTDIMTELAANNGRDPIADIATVVEKIDNFLFKSTFYATRYRVGAVTGIDLRLMTTSQNRSADKMSEPRNYEADRELSASEVDAILDAFSQVLRNVLAEYLTIISSDKNPANSAHRYASVIGRSASVAAGLNGQAMSGFFQSSSHNLVPESYEFCEKLKTGAVSNSV